MDVSAADCAGLHPGRVPQSGGGANQSLLPSETLRAVRPPPTAGSRIRTDAPSAPVTRFPAPSETAAYTLRPSNDIPHWTPPLAPPLPTRVCHTTSPFLSGSKAYTMADFCPARISSRPSGVIIRMGGEP